MRFSSLYDTMTLIEGQGSHLVHLKVREDIINSSSMTFREKLLANY